MSKREREGDEDTTDPSPTIDHEYVRALLALRAGCAYAISHVIEGHTYTRKTKKKLREIRDTAAGICADLDSAANDLIRRRNIHDASEISCHKGFYVRHRLGSSLEFLVQKLDVAQEDARAYVATLENVRRAISYTKEGRDALLGIRQPAPATSDL